MEAVLEKTKQKYGPYKIHYADSSMERERLFNEMLLGKTVNITAQATMSKWEEKLLPIRIPVDKGISEYQIFFIRKSMQSTFSKINTISQLKKFKVGVGSQWSSLPVYTANKFNVVSGLNYEGLFSMLTTKRFDFFPRGINEVFTEYNDRRKAYSELAIEKTILLYFPFPKYFFISIKEPGLAMRVEVGLNMMIDDGSFDKIVLDYHKNIIKAVDFNKRKIIKIGNPFLSKETPFEKKELWFIPLLKK